MSLTIALGLWGIRRQNKEGRPGDGLLYLTGQHPILTAANPEDTRFLTDLSLAQDPASSNTLAGVELPAQEIAARILEFDRIVAVRATAAHSPTNPREEAKTSTLRRHFREYRTTHANGARISVYVREHGHVPRGDSVGEIGGVCAGLRRLKREVRELASEVTVSQASVRTRLRAAAVSTC
ncbi:hypothetical protein [Streptomyces canus]|uniref:hypothetical protein n=1 Tax=Streptomyces canus TaxID=58343 RepID=UPI0027D8053A|nr:hypothetical protein [Streptomyces canus]